MNGLLRGELLLTAEIISGMFFAEIVMRLRIADLLLRHVIPKDIPPVTGLAVALSAGSSKAGAAVLSSALSKNEINEASALWSVLMLPLPSYLRRWPSTLALAVGTAGTAGCIFALSLLVRSIVRFMIALIFLRRSNRNCIAQNHEVSFKPGYPKITLRFLKTLPLAWIFFAVSYELSPELNRLFQAMFEGKSTLLPLTGWSVAAGSIAHITTALSLAGGALSSGELTTSEAVFALILGSGLGTATRILRQNAGYYYGLFPKGLATKMLIMNFATVLPLIIVNLLFAGLALSLWP